MTSPSRSQMPYTTRLPYRFGSCQEYVPLALMISFLPAPSEVQNLQVAFCRWRFTPPVWHCGCQSLVCSPVCRAGNSCRISSPSGQGSKLETFWNDFRSFFELVPVSSAHNGWAARVCTCFVGATLKTGKQSGRYDSNMRSIGPKPVTVPAYEKRMTLLYVTDANLSNRCGGVTVSFEALSRNKRLHIALVASNNFYRLPDLISSLLNYT